MKRLITLLLSLLVVPLVHAADDPAGYDVLPSISWGLDRVNDNTNAGTVTGSNVAFTDLVSCGALTTDANGNVVCSPAPSGSVDITSVGDVTSGAAFDGTQGTTLTFNNAGGDATLDYDGGDFSFSDDLTLGSGAAATATLTSVLSGATDPFLTFSNNTTAATGNLTASATVTGLTVAATGLVCNGFTNGGALTTDAAGNFVCSADESSAGGGDSITVNSSAATDPDFLNGDVDWTLTGGNSITATVGCTACIDATDMGADAVGASEVIESESYSVVSLTASNTVTGAVVAWSGSSPVSVLNGATSAYTLRLPVDDGTNGQFLSTDGSGTLAWTTSSSSGDITGVTAGAGLNGGGASGDVTLNSDGFIIGSGSASSTGFTANFYCVPFGDCSTGSGSDDTWTSPMAGTFSNLYYFMKTAPGAGNDWTCSLVINNSVSSNLTFSTGNANGQFSDTLGTDTIAAGDEIGFNCIESGTATGTAQIGFSIQFTPS